MKMFINYKKFYRNKYFWVTIFFIVYLIFFSQNNLVERLDAIHKRNQLLKQKEHYLQIINEHKSKIEELKTNKQSLEKFVRENYLMKRPDEVIFIVNDSCSEKK